MWWWKKYFADEEGDLEGSWGLADSVYSYLEKLMDKKLWPDEVISHGLRFLNLEEVNEEGGLGEEKEDEDAEILDELDEVE